jgi:hypothetical protein
MRVKALQFAFFAVLGLSAHSGFASSTKPVAHKPDALSHTHSKAVAKVKTADRESREAAPRHVSGKAAKSVEVTHSKSSARTRKAEPKIAASHEKPAPITRRPEPAPASERVEPQEDIQVTHDRKQHFSPEDADSKAAPRKATSADFMSSFAAGGAKAKPAAAGAAPEPVKPKASKGEVKPAAPKVEQQEALPAITPVLFTKRGRLIVPPAMKGSHEILLHQNEMADHDGLDRVRDDADLDQMREDKLLVAVPVGAGLVEDERLPLNRRYCRPWTAQFLTAMSHAYYARFHTPLQVNSAVRTVEFQQRLLMTNGNAAPAEGETASPHLTGQAVDLAKHGLSMTEIAWVRGYLLPLVQAGKVDVEEEFQQACFHISVYRKYMPEPAPKREIAGTHAGTGAALATAIR